MSLIFISAICRLCIVSITYSNQTTRNTLWLWPYAYFYSLGMTATSVTNIPRSSASHHMCSSWAAHSWPPASHAVQYGAPSPRFCFSYAHTLVVFISSDTTVNRRDSRTSCATRTLVVSSLHTSRSYLCTYITWSPILLENSRQDDVHSLIRWTPSWCQQLLPLSIGDRLIGSLNHS